MRSLVVCVGPVIGVMLGAASAGTALQHEWHKLTSGGKNSRALYYRSRHLNRRALKCASNARWLFAWLCACVHLMSSLSANAMTLGPPSLQQQQFGNQQQYLHQPDPQLSSNNDDPDDVLNEGLSWPTLTQYSGEDDAILLSEPFISSSSSSSGQRQPQFNYRQLLSSDQRNIDLLNLARYGAIDTSGSSIRSSGSDSDSGRYIDATNNDNDDNEQMTNSDQQLESNNFANNNDRRSMDTITMQAFSDSDSLLSPVQGFESANQLDSRSMEEAATAEEGGAGVAQVMEPEEERAETTPDDNAELEMLALERRRLNRDRSLEPPAAMRVQPMRRRNSSPATYAQQSLLDHMQLPARATWTHAVSFPASLSLVGSSVGRLLDDNRASPSPQQFSSRHTTPSNVNRAQSMLLSSTKVRRPLAAAPRFSSLFPWSSSPQQAPDFTIIDNNIDNVNDASGSNDETTSNDNNDNSDWASQQQQQQHLTAANIDEAAVNNLQWQRRWRRLAASGIAPSSPSASLPVVNNARFVGAPMNNARLDLLRFATAHNNNNNNNANNNAAKRAFLAPSRIGASPNVAMVPLHAFTRVDRWGALASVPPVSTGDGHLPLWDNTIGGATTRLPPLVLASSSSSSMQDNWRPLAAAASPPPVSRSLWLVLEFQQLLEPQSVIRVLQVLDDELGLPSLRRDSILVKNNLLAVRLAYNDLAKVSNVPPTEYMREVIYKSTGAILESFDLIEPTALTLGLKLPNEHVLALTNPLIGQDSMLDDAVGAQTTLMDSNSINNGPAASLSAHVFGNRAAVLPPRVANGGAGAAAVAAILRRPSSATSAGWLADRTWAIVSAILGALLTFVLVALLFRHRGAVKRKVGSSYQDLSDSKPIDSSDGDCEANLTKRRSLCSKLGSFSGKFVNKLGAAWPLGPNSSPTSPAASSTISGILSGHASQSTPNQAAAIVHSNNNSSTQTSSPIVKENSTELTSQMDISAAHMILAYMEEHLNDKRRLERDWRALSTYKTEPRATTCALLASNRNKNRQFAAAAANNGNSSANNEDANVPKSLPYDHSLVLLNESMNSNHGDYINASAIYDYDPRRPTHIITQAPMAHTVADFWQMIWEQGSSVIVMLTRLNENNVNMCHCYWPNDPKVPNETHGHFEVHLVSEHIICAEYLVRSIYLMNLKTFETRTVTQFHYLAWPEDSVPANVTNFLEFRRKVNKSFRNGGAPIVVHCSDGTGRSGTYTLIDMVLNRISEGAKEIDIAASLEHLRDQRMGVVANMKQFEFVLVAVAAEVQAILDALPQ